MKKILFTLFVFILSLSSWAEKIQFDGIYYELERGGGSKGAAYVVAGENPYTGNINIPGEININSFQYRVGKIKSNAFKGCTGLTSITFGFVDYIESNAFEGCTSLTNISTSYVLEIGSSAFKGCTGLKDISFGGYIKSIGNNAFEGCTNLTNISISSSVNTIKSSAFKNCTNLTSISLGRNVSSIDTDGLFEGCSSLTNITVDAGNSKYDSRDNCNAIIETASNTLILGCKNTSIPNSVTSIGNKAFKGCTSLTTISIPNSVTTIGDNSFYGCNNLSTITIPNSVTSINTSAFKSCLGLSIIKVNAGNSKYDSRDNCNAIIEKETNTLVIGCKNTSIPNSVTKIGGSAFEGCKGLKSITIPNSVTEFGWSVFKECINLTSIEVPNSIKKIEYYTFQGCTGLTSITIPNSVTKIGGSAFENCTSLPRITIPNSVTEIGGSAFKSCTSITSITIPNSVTKIDYYAFSGCTGLTSITIPNSVNDIGEKTFEGCSNLTKTTINSNAIASKTYTSSSNLKTVFGSQVKEYILGSNVNSIGDYAFYQCSEMTKVSIPNTITSIGKYAFYGCSGLTNILIPNSVNSIGEYAFKGTPWYENMSNGLIYEGTCLVEYRGEMPQGTSIKIKEGITTIGKHAFKNCTGLSNISIPNSVTCIEDSAFYGCNGLTGKLTISSSLISIGNSAFEGCIGLTDIPLSNTINRIGKSAFKGCVSLTDVVIPNSVSTIENNTFDGCTNLKSISIPYSVTILNNNAFNGCSSITSVKLNSNAITSKTYSSSSNLSNIFGNQVTEYIFGDSITSIGDYACYSNKSLKSVTIGSSVTNIGSHAFQYCDGLTDVAINSNAIVSKNGNYTYASGHFKSIFGTNVKNYFLGDNINSIGNYTFSGCSSNLTSITIANSVTTIGDYAFSNCTGITNITIPNSVSSIGNYAFYGCKGLTTILIPDSVTSIGKAAFIYCNNLKKVIIEDIATWCKITFNSENSNPLYYAKHLFLNDKEITSLEIPNTVYSIRNYAFFNCESLKSVVIADSVNWIGDKAFYGCTGLNSVSIGNSVNSIGENAFNSCTGLTSVNIKDLGTWCKINFANEYSQPLYYAKRLYLNGEEATDLAIPESVAYIEKYAFYNCSSLKSVTIPNSITDIGTNKFDLCTNLTKVTINSNELCSKNYSENNSLQQIFTSAKEYILGEDVNSIGKYALAGATIQKLTILNPMATINENALKNCTNLRSVYTNRGGTTLLYLWNLGLNTYDVRTFTLIEHPDISFQLTQTTATASVSNYYDEYKYEAYFKKKPNDYYYQEDRPESIEMTDKNYKIKGLKPGAEYDYWMYIKQGNVSYFVDGTYSPTSINPQVDILKKTPTSLHLQGNYTHGDAVFKDQRISFSYNEAENSNIIVKDKLNPNTNYRVKYEVDVLWGENNENTATYKWEDDISTDWIWFDVLEPKVVSVGNVIVASNVNIDDDDAVVGFEWRRMDWPDEISSSTGGAVLYEGTMEGIIRNMNTNYLWKVRPYFKSFDGWDTYYGDWVGFDPSNTSYFQPTVHTYSKVVVNGNTASLKGYAMRGTDNVTSQGFKYWRTTNASSSLKDIDIPSNAQTVTASGQIMTATLTNLEYATNYICVAFVETSEGETFYGEPQTFRTANVTGIEQIQINPDATHATDNNTSESVRTIVGYYNLQGQRITQPQKGIVIVRYSDGTSRKMLVK